MSESTAGKAAATKPGRASGWTFAAFREWREREHPRSNYQISPAVWRPERLQRVAGVAENERRALKGWEPRLTGIAYSNRAVFLVEVVKELSAEHVGCLLYLADLFRRDPDYEAYRGKRLCQVMIVRSAEPSLIAFARRRRIRVVVLNGDASEASRAEIEQGSYALPAPSGVLEE